MEEMKKMKKTLMIKSISLLLVIIMASTALLSCVSSPNEETEGSTDATVTDTEKSETDVPGSVDASKFPKDAFPIFDGKNYTVRVVNADAASTVERQVATTLRSELKKKTKLTITESTDYLGVSGSHDPEAYEILVGKTNHEESTSVYKTVDYNNYGIKTIGRKIVFHFATLSEGEELITLFINALQSNDKKAFWVESALFASKISSPVTTGLPKYPDSNSSVNTGDNTTMIVAKSTSLSSFNTYCNTLKSEGYEEYSKRENIDGNYFRTYTKGETAVTAYFSKGRGQARIIVGPIKDIPSKEVDETPETFKPSVTLIGPSESVPGSLTMIYMLENGKFLIIDGGIILADRIYKELKELQPNATEYVIAGWFVSHPHNDHQDGIEYFIEQHGDDVTIENIYFNYAQASYYNNLTSKDHQDPSLREGPRVTKLRELLDKKVSRNTRIVKPHTGQIYTFGSATVEIISTVEDLLPTALPHVNEASMVVRVTVAGQSTMILADAADHMKGIIRSMYDTHVRSDMVTLAHHGVWDCVPALYNEIKGKVLFWPNNTAGARMYYTDKSSSSEGRRAIQAALDNATDVFLAKGTDTKLMLPDTPVGNKSSFINSTLK